MDIDKAANNEVFRPLVSVLIPGGLALAPFVIVAQKYIPQILEFWRDHDSAFVALVLACMLAAGLAIEDVGASIEFYLIDALISKKDSKHSEEWDQYLQLKTKDEYVGQRYLRNLVTRLKFELSMGPALLISWLGFLWVQCLYSTWSPGGFVLFSLFVIGVSLFMFVQAYLTGLALSKTRKLLLGAVVKEQPPNTR